MSQPPFDSPDPSASEPVPAAPAHPETRHPVPWGGVEVVVVAMVWLASFAVAGAVLTRLLHGKAREVAFASAWELLLAATVVVWVRARHHGGARALGIVRPDRRDLAQGAGVGALGVLVSFAAITVVQLLARALAGAPAEVPEQIPSVTDPVLLTTLGLTVVVAAPLAEELFFRGLLYPALRRGASQPVAAAVSAAIFAVTHLIWVIMPSIFLLGLLLARAVERRGRLAPAILAHSIFNLVGFSVYLATQLTS